MACTHKDSCALFPVISLSSALMIWQTFYCDGQHETCLRFQRSLKGEKQCFKDSHVARELR